MWALGLGSYLQAILALLFADLTAIVAAVIGPTYDYLLVPELSATALYPPLAAATNDPTDFLAAAAAFSNFTLANVVDPASALVAIGVGLLFLARPLSARWAVSLEGLLPRLVIGVVGANFTVPIAGGILSIGGALYPVFAGWDGGAWEQWAHLAGWGEFVYSWDNGVLAFLLSVVEFGEVFALVVAVGVRDAMLAVLLVLLPIFTLLWPLRPLSTLARRAWLLFAELVFLPCVLVIPLELAVGSPNPVLLVGFLAAAVGSPYLLSLAGSQLTAFGFPGAGGTVQGGVAQGMAVTPSAGTAHFAPAATSVRAAGPSGRALAGTVRAAGSATAPMAPPLAVAELIGHGALHLVRHVPRPGAGASGASGWGPVRPGGAR